MHSNLSMGRSNVVISKYLPEPLQSLCLKVQLHRKQWKILDAIQVPSSMKLNFLKRDSSFNHQTYLGFHILEEILP